MSFVQEQERKPLASLPARAPAPLRCLAERIRQSLAYELGGLLLVTPLYGLAFGTSAAQSVTVLLGLSILVMLWTPLYNLIFDWAERELSGRVASDRPQRLRLLHAVLLETTCVVFTLPALMQLGDLSFGAAVLADIGLTVAYCLYAYVFHLIFDALRPVTKGISP